MLYPRLQEGSAKLRRAGKKMVVHLSALFLRGVAHKAEEESRRMNNLCRGYGSISFCGIVALYCAQGNSRPALIPYRPLFL